MNDSASRQREERIVAAYDELREALSAEVRDLV